MPANCFLCRSLLNKAATCLPLALISTNIKQSCTRANISRLRTASFLRRRDVSHEFYSQEAFFICRKIELIIESRVSKTKMHLRTKSRHPRNMSNFVRSRQTIRSQEGGNAASRAKSYALGVRFVLAIYQVYVLHTDASRSLISCACL